MDNLIHASATDEDAEREIKLWFQPTDIPPSMRAYPVEVSEAHYYINGSALSAKQEPGSVSLLAPGDLAWKSDMDSLRLLLEGKPSPCTLESVAAKYLINVKQENG
jgi:nucleoside-diphosphate kinase